MDIGTGWKQVEGYPLRQSGHAELHTADRRAGQPHGGRRAKREVVDILQEGCAARLLFLELERSTQVRMRPQLGMVSVTLSVGTALNRSATLVQPGSLHFPLRIFSPATACVCFERRIRWQQAHCRSLNRLDGSAFG
jgi:hypothetical protein